MAVETIVIRKRWSWLPSLSVEIDCAPDLSPRVKLGLAVKVACETRADLTDAVLTDAVLTGADLTDAVLTDAVLTRAVLTDAVLTGADLTGAVLTRADLTDAVLTDAVLTGADLTDAVLTDAVLTRAVLTRAVLTRADLTGAVLTRAVLTRADLTGAVLTRADLTGAVLTGEALRAFKADHWLTLSSLGCGAADAAHLIAKLRAGEIDGSTYGNGATQCACLVGTIAHGREMHGEALDHNANRPAECWFMMIKTGDKPGDKSGGGFAAQKALEWTLEWCAAHGIHPVAAQRAEAK